MFPWITARLLEQRRKNRPIGERVHGPGQRRSDRRSRWFDRAVPAGADRGRLHVRRPLV
jgi:hypothetical protein